MDQNTQPPSQIPPPLVTQTVPPPPKKNSGIFIGILVFILGIILGMMINETALLSSIRIPYLGVKPTSTPIPLPTPTPDPTASWKMYTDPNNTFSFKYPPEFESDNCGISGPAKEDATNLICLGDPKTIAQGTDKPFDGFSVYTQNLGQQNFKTYIENEKKLQLGWKNAMGNGQTTTGTTSAVSVSGKEAAVLNKYSWDSIERMYIEMPNNTVLIIAKIEESKGSFSAFTQILSTFRFVDNRKTFSDVTTGVSFQYPPDWYAQNTESGLHVFLENHAFVLPKNTEYVGTININYAEPQPVPTGEFTLAPQTYEQYVASLTAGITPTTLVTKTISVGDITGTQISGVTGPGVYENQEVTVTVLPYQKGVILAYLFHKEFLNIYSQILSTVTFTQ